MNMISQAENQLCAVSDTKLCVFLGRIHSGPLRAGSLARDKLIAISWWGNLGYLAVHAYIPMTAILGSLDKTASTHTTGRYQASGGLSDSCTETALSTCPTLPSLPTSLPHISQSP